MPREAEPSLNEKQFVLQALKENLRLDGREFDQYRGIELQFGDEHGVANVTLGKTRYVIHMQRGLIQLILELTGEIQGPCEGVRRSDRTVHRSTTGWDIHYRNGAQPHDVPGLRVKPAD